MPFHAAPSPPHKVQTELGRKIGGGSLKHLSMGMSNDYEVAIEEGATMVRIGTALFGGKVQDHEEIDE